MPYQCYSSDPLFWSDGGIIFLSSLVSVRVRLTLCTKNAAAVKLARNLFVSLQVFYTSLVACLFIAG